MYGLTTATLGHACRLFMEQAYPAGPSQIPPRKRAYHDMDPERPLADYLPPSPIASGICQPLSMRKDGPRGYELRLGSARHPQLKLRVQLVEHRGELIWIYSVDTHDAFSRTSLHPPPDHPDHDGWVEMQEINRHLKEQIEEALEDTGFLTFKSLLRLDLEVPAAH